MGQARVDAFVFIAVLGQFNVFGVEAVFTFFALAVAVGTVSINNFKRLQVLLTKRRSFTKTGHVGAQVVDPDVFGAVFFLVLVCRAALGEEQHVGFHALGVEDAGGQAQDGVQVALVHQVPAHVGAYAGFEQHVVWQHHGGAATGFEVTVDMLQKGQLFVAGFVGQVVTGDAGIAAFAGAEGRVGQDHIGLLQPGAGLAQGVAQVHHAFGIPFHAVQQAVHQGQAAGAGHQFNAHVGLGGLKGFLFGGQVVQVVGLAFDVFVGGNQKP